LLTYRHSPPTAWRKRTYVFLDLPGRDPLREGERRVTLRHGIADSWEDSGAAHDPCPTGGFELQPYRKRPPVSKSGRPATVKLVVPATSEERLGGSHLLLWEVSMKKLFAVGASLVLVAGLSALTPGPADVIREDQGCTFFDGNGDPIGVDCTVQRVYTNNEKGTFNLWGKADLPEEAVLPDRAMHFDYGNPGFTCDGSEDWKGTLTPNGKFSISCKIH